MFVVCMFLDDVIALFYAGVCVACLVREMSVYVCVCKIVATLFIRRRRIGCVVCPRAFVLIDCTYIVCC